MPRKRKAKKPASLIVQFKLNGKRRTISLRGYTAEDVRSVKGYVSRMRKAKAVGRDYDQAVYDWLGQISDEIHAKLVDVGLTEPRQSNAAAVVRPGSRFTSSATGSATRRPSHGSITSR